MITIFSLSFLLSIGHFSAFFGVYSMAVDTIFLCFLEDLERNNGEDRPYLMSKDLKRILGKMESVASRGTPR